MPGRPPARSPSVSRPVPRPNRRPSSARRRADAGRPYRPLREAPPPQGRQGHEVARRGDAHRPARPRGLPETAGGAVFQGRPSRSPRRDRCQDGDSVEPLPGLLAPVLGWADSEDLIPHRLLAAPSSASDARSSATGYLTMTRSPPSGTPSRTRRQPSGAELRPHGALPAVTGQRLGEAPNALRRPARRYLAAE